MVDFKKLVKMLDDSSRITIREEVVNEVEKTTIP
jgi:hypothetical protein